MEVILNQEIKMKQKLLLTPRQQHSLNILQMSLLFLAENISNELNDNPLLEVYNDYDDTSYHDKSSLAKNEIQDRFNYFQEKKTLKDHLIEQAGYLKEPIDTLKVIYYIIESIDGIL